MRVKWTSVLQMAEDEKRAKQEKKEQEQLALMGTLVLGLQNAVVWEKRLAMAEKIGRR